MYLVRFWDFSKRFIFIFDEVYEDFQSNLPLDANRHKSYLSFVIQLCTILGISELSIWHEEDIIQQLKA